MKKSPFSKNLKNIFIIFFIIIFFSNNSLSEVTFKNQKNYHMNSDIIGYIKHNPIYIMNNSGFTFENGVISGNGTKQNPYIIEGWDILLKKGKDQNSYAILIENTDSYFVIRNCYIHHYNSFWSHLSYLFIWSVDWGIHFGNVLNGKIDNCYITGTGHTIRLSNSNNNIISNCYYDSNGCGIGVFEKSCNNSVINCHSHNYVCGVCIYYNSCNNTIKNCSAILSFNIFHSPFNIMRQKGLGTGWVGFYIFEKSSNNKIINCNSYSYEKPLKNMLIKGFYKKTIEGFHLTRESKGNIIQNCTSYNLPVGIRVENSDSSNVVKDCILLNNYYGIFSIQSPSTIFQNNSFIGNIINIVNKK